MIYILFAFLTLTVILFGVRVGKNLIKFMYNIAPDVVFWMVFIAVILYYGGQ